VRLLFLILLLRQYLYWNGWQRFFQWFDHKVWYPLGRPVGTTIYPGMQFTAVWIKEFIVPGMSLNDVCCYIPAWFGVLATVLTGAIAYECSLPVNTRQTLAHFALDLYKGQKQQVGGEPATQSPLANHSHEPAVASALVAMFMMAIVPAHLMRSMGGGYDNESVAVTAMVLTFYCWMRSLRANTSYSCYSYGILTGLAYFYMVAAWGGYVFVLNLIGVHAAVLVAAGRFDANIYWAYTLFYVVGTALAIQVPVVGWAPLKSLEQLGPCAVFLGYQLLYVTERIIRAKKQQMTRVEAMKFRVTVFAIAGIVALLGAVFMAPKGYFGPMSARVRGLFVKHTKTGNPLVDSVAEHQPASGRAYFQYLHHVCSLAPFGYVLVMFQLSDATSFLLVWGAAAYFFSHKMVRLILLTAPIGCILGGMVAGRILVWSIHQWWDDQGLLMGDESETSEANTEDSNKNGTTPRSKEKKKKAPKKPAAASKASIDGSSFEGLVSLSTAVSSFSKTKEGVAFKRSIAFVVFLASYMLGNTFVTYCWRLSEDLSNPTIIMKARLRDGQIIHVDDYREAYWWLRDNTPEDARVMAWWDYGYQLSAIANRTTIADGNTWNHEHIALLGKALTADLEIGWEISRHWADYVLIWAGGGGDDLAKSPHLARIANSVYREHCPDDPTCRAFGFIDRQGTPSSMMRRSLLYNLHGHKIKPDVDVSEDRFKLVFQSKYGKVRIFKVIGVSEESKKWVADPANRKCDAPGSWFCPGQYPPGLKHILDTKTDFHQLEDFNRAGKRDDAYLKAYFDDLNDPHSARKKAM